ncbi:hypothetical protein GQR58_000331 [Nymphon striatum]|nr:hypothetical protein GQR58_000331 [Nymphon striatum]
MQRCSVTERKLSTDDFLRRAFLAVYPDTTPSDIFIENEWVGDNEALVDVTDGERAIRLIGKVFWGGFFGDSLSGLPPGELEILDGTGARIVFNACGDLIQSFELQRMIENWN